jgi:hypothetical protein
MGQAEQAMIFTKYDAENYQRRLRINISERTVSWLTLKKRKKIVRCKIHLRAGTCCTAQPLPSGSLKKTNDPQSNT